MGGPPSVESEEPGDSARAGVRARARGAWRAYARRFPRGPAMLLLTVLVLGLNVPTVLVADQVSPIDEVSWINRLVNGARFHHVTAGERLPQETLRELCERGLQVNVPGIYEVEAPPCPEEGPVDGTDWTYKGVEISGQPPFYFFTTGPAARVLRATPVDLPPNDSLATWGRILGSAWLLLGAYLTLRAGELLAVRRRWVVLGLLFLVAAPSLLHMSTSVNPDQTALPAGAAVLLAGLWWEQRGRGLWVVALTALVGTAFDEANAVGVLVVILYLGIRAVQRRREQGQVVPTLGAHLGLMALLVVAVYLATKGWRQVNSWLLEADIVEPSSRLHDISGNPVSVAVRNEEPTIGHALRGQTITAMFPPFDTWVAPETQSSAFYAFTALQSIVTVAIIGFMLFGARLRERIGSLALAVTVALFITPTLLVLRDWIEYDTFLQPTARFGLSAFPVLTLLVAVASERTRIARYVVLAVGAGLYVAAVTSLGY